MQNEINDLRSLNDNEKFLRPAASQTVHRAVLVISLSRNFLLSMLYYLLISSSQRSASSWTSEH